jgi:hypothetical protein
LLTLTVNQQIKSPIRTSSEYAMRQLREITTEVLSNVYADALHEEHTLLQRPSCIRFSACDRSTAATLANASKEICELKDDVFPAKVIIN